jgi:uncharacterized protein
MITMRSKRSSMLMIGISARSSTTTWISRTRLVKGLRYAAQKGIAVVVMEPLLGGKLAVNPCRGAGRMGSGAVQAHTRRLGFAVVMEPAGGGVVLSGMSTMQQVEENLVSASVSGVGS